MIGQQARIRALLSRLRRQGGRADLVTQTELLAEGFDLRALEDDE